jgi:glycosyltransferase involved in cell wall biosynthesis
MRIGIDARELCGRPTGTGRYLAGLLQEWSVSEQARRHEFVLYASEPIALTLDAHRFATRQIAGRPGWQWEQARVPKVARTDHLDVWFAPAYTAPVRLDVPVVAAIHDLSFVAHPEWFRVREGIRRRWLTRHTARLARAIVTISDFTKRELMERLNVPQERIHVIPPGIATPRPGVPDRTVRHYRTDNPSVPNALTPGPSDPHASTSNPCQVLYVGSIFNRRHVPDLIRGFAPIARARPDAALDIVGDNRSYPRENLRQTIEAEGVGTSVRWRAYVSDEELSALYEQARAFAFLSEYEGLGLTPLEALAAGVPPVLLDTPVARESCGSAALYVSTSDRRNVTTALETILFDEPVRRRVLEAAPAVLGRYSWTRAAEETLTIVEHAAA